MIPGMIWGRALEGLEYSTQHTIRTILLLITGTICVGFIERMCIVRDSFNGLHVAHLEECPL